MFANTLNLPRCAIPITNSLMFKVEPYSTKASRAGINASPPSSEKRF